MTPLNVETSSETQGRIDRLTGAYEMCGRLLTSPRMNRPQREVIEDQAYLVKAELEKLGVTFREKP